MPNPSELYKATGRPEMLRDKIEVSLDGRQIFYLFFGGAVIVGLVFVLGVMVGRRVEARGHVERARTHAVTDPLAALDRLEGAQGLSFQEKLTGGAKATEVENQIADIEKARIAKDPVAAKEAADRAKAEADHAKAEAERLERAKAEAKAAEKEKAAEKKQAGADKPIDKSIEKSADKSVAEKDKTEKSDEGEKKERYTLQLSSFQDRAEAESFLAAVKATGYQPTLTEANVDGKQYFRVRLGRYKSMENATKAKTDYEKSTKKSASIMKL